METQTEEVICLTPQAEKLIGLPPKDKNHPQAEELLIIAAQNGNPS